MSYFWVDTVKVGTTWPSQSTERQHGTYVSPWDPGGLDTHPLKEYYSKLDEHDGMIFLDATLTDKGRQQARTAEQTWRRALSNGLKAPESYYVSPLDRCLETSQITFSGLDLPADRPFLPIVREVWTIAQL